MATLHNFLLAIWIFLPAGAANVAPIFAAHLPYIKRLDAPLDLGQMFGGRPLLGSHKTWRGLAAGIVLATIVVWLQQVIASRLNMRFPVMATAYLRHPALLLGLLFALGALGGDAVESFFKRRAGVPPGKSWVPFDQLDYIAGASLLTATLIRVPLALYGLAFITWLLIHMVASLIGYLVGLKASPV